MSVMKIVVAPQALKGSLTAPDAGAIIAATLAQALPAAQVVVVPVADGGEGTAQALVSATGGRLLSAQVTGPLGAPTQATWGLLGDASTAPDAPPASPATRREPTAATGRA